jgi:uncharacterized membrane protein SirB2
MGGHGTDSGGLKSMNTQMLVSWRSAIVLVVVGVAFLFIGNIGGKGGNPSWLLSPICLLLLIALGIVALRRRRSRTS